MSEPRELRCYQYVNRPYEAVRDLLRQQALGVFQRATTTAAARGSAVGASLHAGAGAVDVGVEIRIHVHAVRDEEGVAGMAPLTRITLGWEAAHAAALFPVMKAEVSFWPLTSTETQVAIEGAYRAPLGPLGRAADAAIGHRVAEAVVHRFLDDVVEQLRKELPESK
jgi:lipid-binding SYLF domain-containing protein